MDDLHHHDHDHDHMHDHDHGHDHDHDRSLFDDQAREQLSAVFAQLTKPVELILFTSAGVNDLYADACRQAIRAFRELTDKISLREFDLDHEMAQKYNVTAAPTVLFNPETHNIRMLGAPVGEEGLTFMETIVLLGYGQAGLGDQAAKVLEAIDSERKVKIFVSPTCPYCPQQAINGIRAAIQAPDKISLELIDVQANPELAQKYDALSTPTAYANETLIAKGAQPEELFMASLQALEQVSIFIPDSDAEEIECDLVIIGGGPAGLTAGIYSARAGLKSVVVEKGQLGGQVATTPVVENYPGLTNVGGQALVDIMVNHALQYTDVFPNEEVVEIEPGEPITVTTTRRRFITRAVLLATGASHRHLGVDGEERLSGLGVSYCSTCDGPLFTGKEVIMVGGGDSAATEAIHLHTVGVGVTLVHRGPELRAQAALVKNLEDHQIPIILNTEVNEIRGRDRVRQVLLYNNETGESRIKSADGVFIAIGYQPAVGLAQKLGVELTPEGYIKKDSHHRTNIPGIYSAGDVEGGYKQIVTAAGQGSEAALAIFEDLVNPYFKRKEVEED